MSEQDAGFLDEARGKRFTIIMGGYTVIDEENRELFFSSGATYHDAPHEVLAAVHGAFLEHGELVSRAMAAGPLSTLNQIGLQKLNGPEGDQIKAMFQSDAIEARRVQRRKKAGKKRQQQGAQ